MIMADERRVPDWLLERVALDEIPPGDREEVARRLAADPTSGPRLEALRASSQEILAALPPAQVVAEVERRARVARAGMDERARRPRRGWIAAGAMAATMAAVLLVVLLPRDGARPIVTPPEDGIRLKGEPRLVVHRKRDGQIERLGRGASARAGDLLQIAYVAAGRSHGVILSIDGGGVVTLHHPPDARASTTLSGGGAIELPHAYELDDAPGFERFVFVTSDRPINPELVASRAHELARDPDRARSAPLDLPESTQQWSLLIAKEHQP